MRQGETLEERVVEVESGAARGCQEKGVCLLVSVRMAENGTLRRQDDDEAA